MKFPFTVIVMWAELAFELLLLVIRRVRGRALVRAAAVCRRWRETVITACYMAPPDAKRRKKDSSLKNWLANRRSMLPNPEQSFALRARELRSRISSVVEAERDVLMAARLKHDPMCEELCFGISNCVGCWCETRYRKSKKKDDVMRENWADTMIELGLRLNERIAELALFEANFVAGD